MKFSQLDIGQRFSYQGVHYSKTGPLQAQAEGAESPRVMMRSASVTLEADTSAGKPQPKSSLEQLQATLADYHQQALLSLEKLPTSEAETRRKCLQSKYAQILDQLQTLQNL